MHLGRQPIAVFLSALLTLSGGGPAAAQDPGDQQVIARIREEGLQRSQVMETALALSDGIGPRLAGSPAYDSAAAWAIRRLAGWQLPEARLEAWGRRGPSWVLEGHSVEVVAPFNLRIDAYPLARSRSLAVLRPSGGPGVIGDGYHTYVRSSAENLPAFSVAQDHYDRLLALLGRGVRLELAVALRGRFLRSDSLGYNVIAELPGSDPALRDEVVMLGGHLDSWHTGTGAADNAAGVAVTMEALRIRGIYLQGNEAVRPIFDRFLDPLRDLGATTLTLASTGETDHMAFVAVGLPGFTFIQDPIDYFSPVARVHHTDLDTGRYLLEEDLKQAAVVVATVVYQAAMRDERLPRGPLPAPRTAVAR